MDGPHVSLNIQPSSRSSQGTIVIVCISRPRRVRTKCQYAACELDSAFAINLAWTCMSLSALCLVKYLTLELTIAVRSTAHPRFGGRIALSPRGWDPAAVMSRLVWDQISTARVRLHWNSGLDTRILFRKVYAKRTTGGGGDNRTRTAQLTHADGWEAHLDPRSRFVDCLWRDLDISAINRVYYSSRRFDTILALAQSCDPGQA